VNAAPQPQYQTANTSDTNSSPNNSLPSTTKSSEDPATIPPPAPTSPSWNLDWNDLVSCSSCNVSISIRLLSPGDDGSVAQTNAVTSTSVSNVINSLQQTLSQQLVPPPAPPAPSVTVAMPVVPPLPLSAFVLPTPAASITETPPVTEPDGGAQAVTDEADKGAAIAPAEPLSDATQPSFAADTSVVPVTPALRLVRLPAHVAAVSEAIERTASRTPLTPPALAPLPAPALADGRPQAAAAEVTAVAAPIDGGSRIPRRAPPPKPRSPADGPDVAAAGTGHASGPPPASTASLLALLLFLVPGFAQWLWAKAELRPSGLLSGRPERPG
jgi:hypothetical protein